MTGPRVRRLSIFETFQIGMRLTLVSEDYLVDGKKSRSPEAILVPLFDGFYPVFRSLVIGRM